jgi:LysR family transcriptional regulator, carnitine catabolism transcriptional activator
VELTVQQLRTVLAVADAGSYAAASGRLLTTPSSVSRTVGEVERRMGVALFERVGRRFEPTPPGRELVRLARDIVAAYERGMHHFDGFLDGTRGSLRVATLPSIAASLLPPVVSRFREQHSEVAVTVEDVPAGDVLRQVDEGRVDLAVTVADRRPPRLDFRPLATDAFYGVFPPGHRFASTRTLPWHRLDGEPFIAMQPGTIVRAHVDGALEKAGAAPRTVAVGRTVAAVAGLVSAGLGVSAVPALVLHLLQFAGLGHVRLRDPEVVRSIGVVLDPDRPVTPAVRAFLATLDDARTTPTPLPEGARWRRVRTA